MLDKTELLEKIIGDLEDLSIAAFEEALRVAVICENLEDLDANLLDAENELTVMMMKVQKARKQLAKARR